VIIKMIQKPGFSCPRILRAHSVTGESGDR